MQRRLAAILAADVVGFSSLMEMDEAGTLAALKGRRRDVLDPLAAKHHGRVFKTTGDGVLVEFASAVNAVQCAVDLQRAMAAANEGQPEDRQIILRIGVNLGDVMVEGSDLYGDGVNIAARLEALAEPGGILVSGDVHRHVRGKLSVELRDLGEHQLKNIAFPVRVYGIGAGESAAVARPTLALPDKPSIAVLPFQNMGGDPEQEYFADGITEDIITALSKWRWFFVIARNSSFAYKGQPVEVKRIGSELGVRYVLEGSVRRTANRVRITTQLVDTLSGNHVWAEKHDGDLVDIFALQDEITASIARAIDPALRLAETQRAIRQPPLVAWDHFMRGAFHFAKYRPDDNATARRHFEAAIALDPHFALAHAQLARTHFFDAFLGWKDASERAFETAYREAERAVSLDEMEAAAQSVLSITAVYTHRHDTALAAGRRAAELNPNYPNSHGSLGLALIFEGRFEEGIACLRVAVRLSPYDSRTWTAFAHALTALGHYGTRDYAAAAQAAQESLSIADSNLLAQCILAAAFAQIDRIEDAHRFAAQLVGRSPALDRKQLAIQFPFRRVTDLENLLDGLRKAGLPE